LGFPGGLFLRRLAAVATVFGASVAGLAAARFAGLRGLDGVRTALGARGTDGFLVEADGFQQFLPPAELDGSGHRAALGLSGVLAAGLASIASASAGLAAIGLASFGVAAFVAAAFGVVVVIAVLPSA
jgi:hypothetical protein